MLAMLPALLQRQGVDPNLVALCQGRGQNGWGGDGIFGILLLFILMGAFNGNGFGFGGGGNRGCWGGDGQGGVVPLLGNQMGQNTNQIITAIMQGNNSIITQMCDCCCSLKTLVTEQGYQGQLRTIQQTQDIVQNATSNANVIAAKIDAQTQIINDKFCALEMREMQRENQNLRDQVQAYQLSASQQQQTRTIIDSVRPCPSPAYWVPNPFGCGCGNGSPYGYPNGNCGGCGNNNGCGC